MEPETLNVKPYVLSNGTPADVAKGFTCPLNSICVQGDNPYSGTVSFDTIYNAMEMVFVVMSTNTFTDIMYDTMATDYMASCLFFIFGVVILAWWLINILIAAIAVSFRLAREEAQHRRKSDDLLSRILPAFSKEAESFYPALLQRTSIGKVYSRTHYVWLVLIAADLIAECTVSSGSSQSHVRNVYYFHCAIAGTMIFDVIWRFMGYLPYWRYFFKSFRNIADVLLAIANVLIILPFVHNNIEVYSWLTVFQLARFYRIVISNQFVRSTWARVLGNYRVIFNLTAFYFLMTFLVSIMAGEMLRGVVPFASDSGQVYNVSFYDLGNSFIGMYQISTSENWTNVMYTAIQFAPNAFAVICYGLFFVGWFILSNFVVLNMFIAVITETLELTSEEKRKGQIRQFFRDCSDTQHRSYRVMGHLSNTTGDLLKFFGMRGSMLQGNTSVQLSAKTNEEIYDALLSQDIVGNFLITEESVSNDVRARLDTAPNGGAPLGLATYHQDQKFVRCIRSALPKWCSDLLLLEVDYKRCGQYDIHGGMTLASPSTAARNLKGWHKTKFQAQQQFLKEHPKFDRALFFLKNDNKLRRSCQRVVAPSSGERINGVTPHALTWQAFQISMFLATIAMVVISCVNTPVYNKILEFESLGGWNWVMWCDVVFVTIFSIEALIKIVADGFRLTPNAYLKSTFNVIDFVVLVTLWIVVLSNIFSANHASRYVRSIQAFRVLRLLSISSSAMGLFESVFVNGIRKMLGATVLSLCLIFPFALWGKAIYRGRLNYCTDGSVGLFSECVDEYASMPFNWPVVAPRAMKKRYFDYDTFGHSLLVQFQVIALDGWIDVLNAVMAITGPRSTPQEFASRYNGIFPVLYSILSTIFVLTVFVSVIIGAYSQHRGSAYLTDEQLTWYEVEKVLGNTRPWVVPPKYKKRTVCDYAQKITLNKSSWLYRLEISILVVVSLLLLSEFEGRPSSVSHAYAIIAVAMSSVLLTIHLIKLAGLGFRSFMRTDWCVFGIMVALLSFIFSVSSIARRDTEVLRNIRKLGFVGMMLLWIPRSKRLDQLLRTALASARDIGHILVAWFVFFLGYAIALNQSFGLARIGANGSEYLNVRTVPKALVLLFRMSCGEGWNQILSDFLISPPYCIPGNSFFETECANHAYAYILFCSWNVLSLYIFVNLFVSLIYENFSYFFHRPWDIVSTEDISQFQRAWSKLDPNGSGYISPNLLHKLLRTTTGYFSFKIYEGEFSVPEILRHSGARNDDKHCGVDYAALHSIVQRIPVDVYKQKRRDYERFCAMALLEADENGIAFNRLIRLFPLYKSMDESRCLKYVSTKAAHAMGD